MDRGETIEFVLQRNVIQNVRANIFVNFILKRNVSENVRRKFL
jgi:hypothetical protein